MKNNKGLTLVELLGVLVVLGIVVAIVVPNITKNLKSIYSSCMGKFSIRSGSV